MTRRVRPRRRILIGIVETGDIGMSLPDNKYVSRLLIRMDIDTEEPGFGVVSV